MRLRALLKTSRNAYRGFDDGDRLSKPGIIVIQFDWIKNYFSVATLTQSEYSQIREIILNSSKKRNEGTDV